MNDYLACDTAWDHGLDAPESGVRVMTSVDKPGLFILQIRCQNGRVASARLSDADLAAIHRQAMTA